MVSAAAALTLECKVKAGLAGGGYITDIYVFRFDEAKGTALAADGWILHYHDAPIAAKVSDNTKKKLVLTWNLTITNGSGQQTKMQYRAAYFKGTGDLNVSATPGGGYSGNFEGRGTCKAR